MKTFLKPFFFALKHIILSPLFCPTKLVACRVKLNLAWHNLLTGFIQHKNIFRLGLLLLHNLTVTLNNNLFIYQKSPPGICCSWFDGSTITGWNPWCLSFWLIVPHSAITPACRKREGQNFILAQKPYTANNASSH